MKTVEIIASKSDAHRALICAALSEYTGGTLCDVEIGEVSEDVEATRKCLVALLTAGKNPTGADLYCGESGSTFRFLLPLVGALGMHCTFHPRGRLSKRPIEPLSKELRKKGMSISEEGSIPFIAGGKLEPGTFTIPGDVSSQFISGLLFALPLLDGDSRIIVKGRMESSGYVDMTVRTQQIFGIRDIDIKEAEGHTEISVRGNQVYRAPKLYRVEGDWSNAAFWIVAGLLGDRPLAIKGLDPASTQGDRVIAECLIKAGADIRMPKKRGKVIVHPSRGSLKAFCFDASGAPDLVPALALAASLADGTSEIRGAARLRMKESDRLKSVSSSLWRLGADIEEYSDRLVIRGRKELSGGLVESFSDHRIAMMEAIASLVCKEKVILIGSSAVNKSYPGFFDKLKEAGLADNVEPA